MADLVAPNLALLSCRCSSERVQHAAICAKTSAPPRRPLARARACHRAAAPCLKRPRKRQRRQKWRARQPR